MLVGLFDGLPQVLWPAFGEGVLAGGVGLVGDLAPGAVRRDESGAGLGGGELELGAGWQVELGEERERAGPLVQQSGVVDALRWLHDCSVVRSFRE